MEINHNSGAKLKIAVLGTGMVGRALAGRLAGLNHDVVIGTRDVEQTLARTETDPRGWTPPFAEWQQNNPDVRLLSFAQAGAHGELVINATAGEVSLAALEATGAENLSGKVLIDIALPLDRSSGMPPQLRFAHTHSLGEQIQRAYPNARVVKTLNTVAAHVMVEPTRLPGEHNVFLSGDDPDAKETVRSLLGGFGWSDQRIIDLGGIQTARSVEMYMQLFFNLFAVFGDFDFNIAVVRA